VPAIFHPRDEQALVRKFFDGRVGTFADVGAHEPVVNSQTYHLESRGWNGVLIEPIPELAERLSRERKSPVFQVACGAQEGVASFQVAGVYSSLLPVREGSVEREIQVRIRTLDSILAESGIEGLDFLSIDVEGFEVEVLRGLSLERRRPKLILIEDHVTDLSKHRYLVAHGYKLVRRTGVNAWYVPREHEFRVGLYGRLQLFRKYVIGLPIRKLRHALRKSRLRTAHQSH
jgi:FkbM family methyltransferase